MDRQQVEMMKLLKSDQKSAMQYCLTESKTWPSFQKIALRMMIKKRISMMKLITVLLKLLKKDFNNHHYLLPI
uniref:Uncharacterized protein n=1 Tax=Romanomermis culicivorax TaxID=13658 RepID=A0A915HMZ9_ROMCU